MQTNKKEIPDGHPQEQYSGKRKKKEIQNSKGGMGNSLLFFGVNSMQSRVLSNILGLLS